MTRKKYRTHDVIQQELDGVGAEIADIELYLEGSLQQRDATYRRKDGTLARHKATPSLQYPRVNGQGRMRIPWKHVALVEELLREGTRRRGLLARHRDLSRELAQALMCEGGSTHKKTLRSPLHHTSHPASAN